MTDIRVLDFDARDGIRIAVHETGPYDGHAVILIHGFFSSADNNWIKYGHAKILADAGFRVVMPDLRGHGMSDKPHDAQFYPKDILASDMFDLIDDLGTHDFDLCGYSLGGRTVARMLARGCQPRRAIIAGMGLEGLTDTASRVTYFQNILNNLGQHERGSPAWMAEAFLKTTKADPIAMLRLLDTSVDTPVDVLGDLDPETYVICGEDDQDNGSAQDLADVLPHGRYIAIPGTHMGAVTQADLGLAICNALKR
jgi:pimeloyl-ACP methyl ester carboxylesterase